MYLCKDDVSDKSTQPDEMEIAKVHKTQKFN